MFRGESSSAANQKLKDRARTRVRARARNSLADAVSGCCRLPLHAAMLVMLLLTACRPEQDMANQPSYDPLEPSTFFGDGQSARPRVEGTVARGTLKEDTFLYTGKVDGKLVDSFPFPVTKQVLERGRQRYDIYCSMCHGQTGYGDGMVVRRGYRKPPSFHTAILRNQKTGHFVDVITNGFGVMPSYGYMVAPEDRWAITAYIRALQLSQNATLDDVPPSEQQKLGALPK